MHCRNKCNSSTQAGDFAIRHHVLSQARWDSRAVAGKLLTMILDRFLPAGPVEIGIADTIERRRGPKIAARGIYRDPVRAAHGHVVTASGLTKVVSLTVVCGHGSLAADAPMLGVAVPHHPSWRRRSVRTAEKTGRTRP